jgi:predicted transcriptional regulator
VTEATRGGPEDRDRPARKPDPEAKPSAPERQQRRISDYRTMRALAHPVRLALLDAIRREGTLTASAAAELLEDTPGNMSWHLQTLAKYGFIEEAGGGRGRSRPWRAVAGTIQFGSEDDDPQAAEADAALEATALQRIQERLREWWEARPAFPRRWRAAAFLARTTTYLTVEELEELSEAVQGLLDPYAPRLTDRSARPEGARPVEIVAFGHPLPPLPSGN